jgi:hypothetical protein
MIRHSAIESNRALNEVLLILEQSLPMYLRYARPWIDNGDKKAGTALASIVTDSGQCITRLAALLDGRRHTIDHGEFPMAFTSMHDLSLHYLVPQLAAHQRRDVDAIANRLTRLNADPEGRDLVEDILVKARHHVESLEALQATGAEPGVTQ